MKTILKTIAVSLLLIVVGAGGSLAWAKNKNPATNYPSLVGASEIKGTHVKNLQNQDLGQIDEVLIDPDTGQVRFVILEVGGFLGLGATRVAVPLSAFQITQEGDTSKWVLDADKEKLKNAPKVEGKNYQRLYTRCRGQADFCLLEGYVDRARVQFQSVISKPAETKSMNATAQRTEAATLLAASEVKGATVINFQNENIGDVDELLIEPDTGQVRFAVLSVGGFLGLGSTKVAVPWLAFRSVSERGKIRYMMLDATRERLEKAPRVEGKNYERLYPANAAEPIFVYWEVEWTAGA